MNQTIRRRIGFFAVAIGAALSLGACQTVQTTQAGAVGVDRQQSFMVSASSVNSSAAKAYQQVMAEAQKKGQLNRDPAQLERVRAIASRLIANVAAFRPDAPGWKWEVNVITSPDVNAWCMPGGKIAVYTGLIERLKITDEELAAVMGHEIAHALREHGRERASQAAAQSLAIGVVGAVLGIGAAGQDISQTILDVTFNLPNSRLHETEADRVGVELAARAGFDPHAAISLWQKMGSLGGSRPPQFLSTHPSHGSRIRDIEANLPKVLPFYDASRKAQ